MVTIDPRRVERQDAALSSQVPGDVPVFRTHDLDPAKWLDALSPAAPPPAAERGTDSGAGPAPAPAGARRLWASFKRRVRQLLTDSPDSHLFWCPFAFLRAARIVLSQRVDVIYCSSPPHSSHLVAYLIARLFSKPYVLDFRDPWSVRGSHTPPVGKLRSVLALETLAKKAIVRKAAAVIAVSPGERNELRTEYPDLPAGRFVDITNGYDPSDFAGAAIAETRSSRLTLTHAGTIYPGAGAEFFEGLERLVRDHPGVERRLRVNLIGEIADEYAGRIKDLERAGVIHVHGTQPHATTLRMVLGSDVLIILLGGSGFLASEIPAKTFEYLYAGRPVLAISREGDLTEILRTSGLGIVVPPGSSDQVARALWTLCNDHDAGTLKRAPNTAYIRSFERSALAAKLAAVLDGAKQFAVTGRTVAVPAGPADLRSAADDAGTRPAVLAGRGR